MRCTRVMISKRTKHRGTLIASQVMDASAVALCRDNHIPIVVFNIRGEGNLAAVLRGEGVSTVVTDQESQ